MDNHLHDYPYLALLNELYHKRDIIQDERTGTGAVNLFGRQMRFNLAEGFPLLTTKKVHFHSIVHELLWFIKGDTNIKYLLENNVHIWTEWRYKQYLDEFNELANTLTPTDTPYTMKEFEQELLADPKFAEQYGDIGKGYGHQWRNFGSAIHEVAKRDTGASIVLQRGFDQISWIIDEIKNNPSSRRLIVSGWNPHEVDKVDLPPCHTLFQFFVEPMTYKERAAHFAKHCSGIVLTQQIRSETEWQAVFDNAGVPSNKLSCQLYQRSADIFLGVPFNIASYALLTNMVAQVCGLALGEFVWTGGIVHLYANHIEQAHEQLKRIPTPAPDLSIDKGISFFDIKAENIHLSNYNPHPAIKAPVAV